MFTPDLDLLECTLRDGSYTISFQFTARDTALIAEALEDVGFTLIEVGHGIGLGASAAGMGDAAETDEAYMRSAASALSRAKAGVFCIPGIASLDHVDLAADCGMGFIRIGTNVTEAGEAGPFIERARKRGLMVCANFMKSYACSPDEFGEIAYRSAQDGAQVIYVVDSAGGMMPHEVRAFCHAVLARTAVKLGFHGHNNLGLGVSNAIVAVECGACLVDTSLQGLGRSGGNTPTEQFVSVLARRGLDLGIDPIAVMDVGERFIAPLITRRGLNSLDIVLGLAQFHSSYMGIVRRFASLYDVDPRRLVMRVAARDKVHAPLDIVDQEARRLAKENQRAEASTARFAFQQYCGAEQR